jgi:hypothetical protein
MNRKDAKSAKEDKKRQKGRTGPASRLTADLLSLFLSFFVFLRALRVFAV